MNISISKTETMLVSRSPATNVSININDKPLQQVQEFKYLGSIFTEDGKLDREIETRCQKANNITFLIGPLLSHPAIPMKAKKTIISAIFTPTLCYQAQTWSMSKKADWKITTCEMKCLRKAANNTRRDKIRNEVIRDMVGTKPILSQIEHQHIKWFGHRMRMNPKQPALHTYCCQLSGTKLRGRPQSGG